MYNKWPTSKIHFVCKKEFMRARKDICKFILLHERVDVDICIILYRATVNIGNTFGNAFVELFSIPQRDAVTHGQLI